MNEWTPMSPCPSSAFQLDVCTFCVHTLGVVRVSATKTAQVELISGHPCPSSTFRLHVCTFCSVQTLCDACSRPWPVPGPCTRQHVSSTRTVLLLGTKIEVLEGYEEGCDVMDHGRSQHAALVNYSAQPDEQYVFSHETTLSGAYTRPLFGST